MIRLLVCLLSALAAFSVCPVCIFCLPCLHFLSALSAFAVCIDCIFCLPCLHILPLCICCLPFLFVLPIFYVCLVCVFCQPCLDFLPVFYAVCVCPVCLIANELQTRLLLLLSLRWWVVGKSANFAGIPASQPASQGLYNIYTLYSTWGLIGKSAQLHKLGRILIKKWGQFTTWTRMTTPWDKTKNYVHQIILNAFTLAYFFCERSKIRGPNCIGKLF